MRGKRIFSHQQAFNNEMEKRDSKREGEKERQTARAGGKREREGEKEQREEERKRGVREVQHFDRLSGTT